MKTVQLQLILLLLTLNLFGQAPLNQPTNSLPNPDWVYYFSNALYSRWIPDENIIPYLSTEIGLKQKFGTTLRDGVSTGTDTVNINTIFIDGPNHSQYKNYVYMNKYLTNDLIYYTAVFRLKKIQNTGPGDEVCKVQAVAKRGADSTILAEKVITKSDLGSEYTEISLDYNYGVFQEAARGRGDLQFPPTTLLPGIEVEDSYLSEGTTIQLRVVWLGNAEIALKDVEVFDQKIWKHYFINYPVERDIQLGVYLAKLRKIQPEINGLITMLEPRLVDSYQSRITLLAILKGLGAPLELIAGYYPVIHNQSEVNKVSHELSVKTLQRVGE